MDISHADRERFLHLIRSGDSRRDAASKLGKSGLTATKFRALSKRDPDFAAAYDEALQVNLENRAPAYVDQIRAEIWRRVADHSISDRLLTTLAITYDPDFSWLRRQRLEVTGMAGGPLEVANVDVAELRARLARVVDLDEERVARRLAVAGNGGESGA